MAAVDPYAPCPCGSGQKFKWCCHKAESYADRAQRLLEGNQGEAALAALDEGLAKYPDNPWLLTRKAVVELRRGRIKEARATLEKVIAHQPGHVGAHGLLTRIVLETEGPVPAVQALQRGLQAASPENRPVLATMAQLVGVMLAEVGLIPAAIEHLSLALEMMPGDDEYVESSLRTVLGNPTYSPWLRQIYDLSPAPEGVNETTKTQFDEAIGWAREGLWSRAASAFELLSGNGIAGADRNLGLCRLWLAEEADAARALRRHNARAGETAEAVDLEALCQLIAPLEDDDQIEQVQLIWPLRDRSGLLQKLQASDRVQSAGRSRIDPSDEKSPEVDEFLLLDRPKVTGPVERPEDVPRISARLLVGQEIVALETYDDGRINDLTSRFVDLAGPSIPPAHPKTKVLGEVPKVAVALQPEWALPEGLGREATLALHRRDRARVVRDVWPETPMPYLVGRTPRQAAKAGDARVPLRAAICQLELTHEFFRDDIDFVALRSSLGVGPEPEIDPETVEPENVHLGRLHRIPAARLSDENLATLFLRAHSAVMPLAMERSALAVVDRPSLLSEGEIGHILVYSDLANLALSRDDRAEAFDWARKGREADPRREDMPRWDMLEIRLSARSEPPEAWVPRLAVILERYRDHSEAGSWMLSNLVDMGLIQVAPNPDNPEQMLLDTRPLQALLAEYGPKITTASGQLGVSVSQGGGLWTPESERGGSTGGLWTPGSGSAEPRKGDDKPKLIIPGR